MIVKMNVKNLTFFCFCLFSPFFPAPAAPSRRENFFDVSPGRDLARLSPFSAMLLSGLAFFH